MAFKALGKSGLKSKYFEESSFLLDYLQASSTSLSQSCYIRYIQTAPYILLPVKDASDDHRGKLAQLIKTQIDSFISLITSDFYSYVYLDMLTANSVQRQHQQIPSHSWSRYRYYLQLIATAKCPCTFTDLQECFAKIGISQHSIRRFADECLESKDGSACRVKQTLRKVKVDLHTFSAISGPNYLGQNWRTDLENNKIDVDPLFVKPTKDENMLAVLKSFVTLSNAKVIQSFLKLIFAAGIQDKTLISWMKLLKVFVIASSLGEPVAEVSNSIHVMLEMLKDYYSQRPAIDPSVCKVIKQLLIEQGMEVTETPDLGPQSADPINTGTSADKRTQKFTEIFERRKTNKFAKMKIRKQKFEELKDSKLDKLDLGQIAKDGKHQQTLLTCFQTYAEIDPETTTCFIACNFRYSRVVICLS